MDDEEIVRESLFHWFKKYGYVVETASSGFEALDKLEKHPFQLLFVDIKMPGMDGIELLEKVKTEYPDTIVIIITAYGSIESAVKAMRIGASDYLLKPFKPDQLSLVMERASHQKRLLFEHDYLKGRLEKITRFDNIIGQSPAMEHIFRPDPGGCPERLFYIVARGNRYREGVGCKSHTCKKPSSPSPLYCDQLWCATGYPAGK